MGLRDRHWPSGCRPQSGLRERDRHGLEPQAAPLLILAVLAALLKKRLRPLWLLAWVGAPPVMGAITQNVDDRYYLGFFLAGYLVFLAALLAPRSPRAEGRWTAIGAVAALTVFQMIYVTGCALGSQKIHSRLRPVFQGPGRRMVAATELDPFYQLISIVRKSLPPGRNSRITFLPVEFFDDTEDGGRSEFNDPHLWLELTREAGEQLQFVRLPPSLNYEESLKKIAVEKVDYLVVPKTALISDSANRSVNSAPLALGLIRENRRLRIAPVATFTVQTRQGQAAAFDVYEARAICPRLSANGPAMPLVLSPAFF